MDLMEGLVRFLFKRVLDVDLPNPFPRLSYEEAMRRYASDKPDLRIPLELTDVADLVARAATSRSSPVRPRIRKAVSPRCACRRAASFPASRSTTTARSSAVTAPRDWPTSRSTTWQRAARACRRRS